ncbi:MAG: outer membrane protein transport protein [Xanthomonadales bacterium]|jgi:long-chain fatty acid transport protein|nr:outer membrane protein transport protein [Xanthomonadales bacterium]
MSKYVNWFTATTVAVGLCVAGNAFATNGYFTHGTGTKNKAMAGSGIALPEDAIDITNNPAVAPFVGDQLGIGAAVFSPVRKYETSDSMLNGQMGAFTIGPNKITSDSNYFVLPHIAKTWQLDNGNAWALAFYGRGGMNTNWKGGTATFDPDGQGPAPVMTFPGTYGDGAFGGNGNAGVNLSQAFFDVTWAKKVNDNFSFGVSAVLVAQMFEAKGVRPFSPYTETFASSGGMTMPDKLSNNSTDWSYGYGLKIGMHAPINDMFSFGAMYQTKISMTEFDDYSDLFAEQGDFDIPADLKIGLTLHTSESLAFNFDIEHIWYSDIDAVGNPIMNIFSCPTAGMGGMNLSSCLGGNNGAGFGWDDMTVYKIGMRWSNNEDWTWRLGYSYGEQPIPDSEMTFNILAPATIEQHITAGFTLERTEGREFSMAFMFAPNSDLTGPQNFDPTQTVTFEMYQWEVEASYSWRF